MEGRPNEDDNEYSDGQMSDSMAWKDFFGSSVSLAPSLLSIFDRQVAATGSESDSLLTDVVQESHRNHDIDQAKDTEQLAVTGIRSHPTADSTKSSTVMENELLGHTNNNKGNSADERVLSHCGKWTETDIDMKKRPLSLRSISSTTSSSSLSLQQHRRKKVARDASLSLAGKAVSPSISCCDSSSELRTPTRNMKHVSGGSLHNRLSEACHSNGLTMNHLDFCDRKSEECLSATEAEDDFISMDVDQDLDWSPTCTADLEISEKHHSCLHAPESPYTDRIILEIVETERAYVRDLQDIIKGYVEHVQALPGLLSKQDVDTLFGNIENIHKFHSDFLRKLERCGMDPVRIAECFVHSSNGFSIYSDYCTNYPRSVGVLSKCMQDRRITDVLKRQQMSLQHGLPLGSYLLKPVQRILKYHLLLQNLLNNYNRSNDGYQIISQALGSMMNVAQRINELKRAHEHSVRVQEIHSVLYEWNGVDLNSYGDLILEDHFQVYGAKACRLVWLFRKAVIIAKKKEDETVQVKAAIMFSNLMLVETIQRAPLSFHLVPFDSPKTQYTVQARSVEQKRQWCQEIKRLILENYEAVIPEKAKQLVMMLGKEEEPTGSPDTENVPVEPIKPSGHLERRKNRQRSAGFISELGLLKSKKGSKVESPGCATPELDPVWKNGEQDLFGQSLDLKEVVSESVCQDLDQKGRPLHGSFSLQNIRNPTMTSLKKLGASDGDWNLNSSDRHHYSYRKKLLTAESVEEEFSESDPCLGSAGVTFVDWTSSKDTLSSSQTPPISEEPVPVDMGIQKHMLLQRKSLTPNNSICDEDIRRCRMGIARNGSVSGIRCSSGNGFPEVNGSKFRGAVSLDTDQFFRDNTPPDHTKVTNVTPGVQQSLPLYENRSCSSDSLIKNSQDSESFGNIFINRFAFLVSGSVGCLGSNRLLDRRLARLCTPPRELGSPAFTRDVELSRERGRTVVHYGTPMRVVEFPEDVCGGGKIEENDTMKILTDKTLQHPTLSESSGSVEGVAIHPVRSTSMQENMVHSCVQFHGEKSTQPKRSGSFHGNSVYSVSHLPSDQKLNESATSPKSPVVSSLKSTLLSWTGKLTKRRSRSSENRDPAKSESAPCGDEAKTEKMKPNPGLFMSRLARASYRRIRRDKPQNTYSSDAMTSEQHVRTPVGIAKIIQEERESDCKSRRSVSRSFSILGTYWLPPLPRTERYREDVQAESLQTSNDQATRIMKTVLHEPKVKQQQQNHRKDEVKGDSKNTAEQKLPVNDVDHLWYINEQVHEQVIAKNNVGKRNDSTKTMTYSQTKILQATRNGSTLGRSLPTPNQVKSWTQPLQRVGTKSNCFTAPHSQWIPYIDDSGDDD